MSTAPNKPDAQDESATSDETFTTDISETDDEGTSVRQAEVRTDDLSETKQTEGDANS
ncbi:hypothetical protein QCE63_34185 [Caballeronia sp. LZ065]|uniref:hypothetical protein n=1 Tax=Caballeronia sp. LZ065 TaxID=3038571 RepID=UPI002861FC62|nr:hypothetical protein [Caballeronia sp. LZ065]MDR5784465.1 hypothetical protein [Caballeronia sp. LZ065]